MYLKNYQKATYTHVIDSQFIVKKDKINSLELQAPCALLLLELAIVGAVQ